MHWPLYEHMRIGLQRLFARGSQVRDACVIGLVSYVALPEFSTAPFREAIAAVPGMRRADMTILGGVGSTDLSARLPPYREHLAGAVPGVRALGCTFHDRKSVVSAMQEQLLDIAFVRYNPAHPGAEREIFPFIPDGTKTLLFNFNSTRCGAGLARLRRFERERRWRPRLVDYYRFALTQTSLDGLLCSLRTPADVMAITEAVADGPLTDAETAYLRDLVDGEEKGPYLVAPAL